MVTVEVSFHPEYVEHQFNVVADGKFAAYAHTEKAARWAAREWRRMVWKMRIERVIERYLGR